MQDMYKFVPKVEEKTESKYVDFCDVGFGETFYVECLKHIKVYPNNLNQGEVFNAVDEKLNLCLFHGFNRVEVKSVVKKEREMVVKDVKDGAWFRHPSSLCIYIKHRGVVYCYKGSQAFVNDDTIVTIGDLVLCN